MKCDHHTVGTDNAGESFCATCGIPITKHVQWGYDGVPQNKTLHRKPNDMANPESLTNERKSAHGDWHVQAATASMLKRVAEDSPNMTDLQPYQREAIDMILTKVSRILCGNPNEPDHWDDIAGYAFLGNGGHKPQS